MSRWEPNARERLVCAALDLFTERGYEATTVNEIAERAGGLTKTTFFRHFSDKREVLFAGQEIHRRLISDAIAAAPESATPLQAVAAALDALTETFTEDRREFSGRLLAVLAANSELTERAASKRAALANGMTEALGKRGVPDPQASLAAELGARAFYRAFDQWADPANQQELAELARRELDELRAALATLDLATVSGSHDLGHDRFSNLVPAQASQGTDRRSQSIIMTPSREASGFISNFCAD